MDISLTTKHWIETGTTIGTGLLAWEVAATQKWATATHPTAYGVFDKNRFGDALAGLIGHDNTRNLMKQAFGYDWGGAADFHPTPMGALNSTTFTGIGLLAADYILREIYPPYKRIPVIPEMIKGAGKGVTVGGIVGGIFDPNPSGYTTLSRQAPVLSGQGELYGGVATGNVPFSRAGTLAQLSVLQ